MSDAGGGMMTPQEIVHELDKYIVGQAAAKRAVAIALRNRWRRSQVAEPLRTEITPKNILMIGPTGVGKTEIARRLARLANAPFIKVEATKFTEVGYVGRDVDSIIRDLVEIAVKNTREQEMHKVRTRAQDAAEERILDALLPGVPRRRGGRRQLDAAALPQDAARGQARRQGSRDRRGAGFGRHGDPRPARHGRAHEPDPGHVREPRERAAQAPHARDPRGPAPHHRRGGRRLVNEDEIRFRALASVEQDGIVFIDEIDKIASRGELQGADVSRQGVQRDLLPLVEGTAITTKYGIIRTDHILFIASGAFHLSRPSDLIPELQGRLPIRVELSSLGVEEFERILTSTDACLTTQYQALLGTENVELTFTPDGVRRMAEIAFAVNERTENIGARRLYTVMEKLLEEVSFDSGRKATRVTVDAKYVDERLADLAKSEDLARYVL
jgi:ATP-dependent HslUV protease ATP-binding subunit HslU